MFKIGDRVRCIAKPAGHQYPLKDHNCIGKIYIVTKYGSNDSIALRGETGYFDSVRFTKAESATSEIEWLDRVQENFKEF